MALALGVAVTTVCWLAATWLTPPTDRAKLSSFYERVRPPFWGWRAIGATPDRASDAARYGFLAWPVAVVAVYALLFTSGALLFGRGVLAACWALVFFVCLPILFRLSRKLDAAVEDSRAG